MRLEEEFFFIEVEVEFFPSFFPFRVMPLSRLQFSLFLLLIEMHYLLLHSQNDKDSP